MDFLRALFHAVLLVGAIALITHDEDARPEPPTVQVEREPNAGSPGSVG